MTTPILKDTGLCAIVRDELMNPAGGIKRFVRAIMPHVEAGVIIDTGSIDGTRQALEELQKEFSALQVYDIKFVDYAQARNFSLRKVKTKRALVLDADELIEKSSFERLCRIVEGSNATGHNFYFKTVFKNLPEFSEQAPAKNPRLFNMSKRLVYTVNQRRRAFEVLCIYDTPLKISPLMTPLGDYASVLTLPSSLPILHFLPPEDLDAGFKFQDWYDHPENFSKAPSTCPNFKKWKAFNPRRDEYDI